MKHLDYAKSKLGTVLDDDARRELVISMLEDVVLACKSAGLPTLVVSPDEKIISIAKELGCMTKKDDGKDINTAFEKGIEEAEKLGFEAVLLLPADLPLLSASELEEIVNRGTRSPVVICPNKNGGTGALFLKPPRTIPLRFGGRSFSAHVEESLLIGIRPEIYTCEGTYFDLDEPTDIPKIFCLAQGKTKKSLLKLARQIAHQPSSSPQQQGVHHPC